MSDNTLTDAEIQAMLALAERATAGPWRSGRKDMQSHCGLTGKPFSSVYADDERGGIHLSMPLPLTIATVPGESIPRDEEKANADFIAVCRRDTPWGTQPWITDDPAVAQRMLTLARENDPGLPGEALRIVRFDRAANPR